MSVHIGNNVTIGSSELIAVLDINTLKKNRNNHMLYSLLGTTVNDVKLEDAKSVIVTSTGVYLASLSASTLRKRMSPFNQEDYKSVG